MGRWAQRICHFKHMLLSVMWVGWLKMFLLLSRIFFDGAIMDAFRHFWHQKAHEHTRAFTKEDRKCAYMAYSTEMEN